MVVEARLPSGAISLIRIDQNLADGSFLILAAGNLLRILNKRPRLSDRRRSEGPQNLDR
jgi:hypothetical protein